jgi:hypothetical protein
MPSRIDQLAGRICRAALSQRSLAYTHYAAVSDGRTVAIWFLPDPAWDAERERLGLLGRMTEGATMLAPFHHTPDIDELRDCVQRHLTMNKLRVEEARRKGAPCPPFPRLWVLSTERPESVIKHYELEPMRGWPSGFLGAWEADAIGLVVLRELPRERSTLLLRLMGAGAVLTEAIADVTALPADAWERTVTVPVLLALRLEIAPYVPDDKERTHLLSTMALYEEWVQKTKAEGRAEAMKESLVAAYGVRFGALPADLAAAIETTHDTAVLNLWLERIVVGTQAEIAAALRSRSAALN